MQRPPGRGAGRRSPSARRGSGESDRSIADRGLRTWRTSTPRRRSPAPASPPTALAERSAGTGDAFPARGKPHEQDLCGLVPRRPRHAGRPEPCHPAGIESRGWIARLGRRPCGPVIASAVPSHRASILALPDGAEVSAADKPPVTIRRLARIRKGHAGIGPRAGSRRRASANRRTAGWPRFIVGNSSQARAVSLGSARRPRVARRSRHDPEMPQYGQPIPASRAQCRHAPDR